MPKAKDSDTGSTRRVPVRRIRGKDVDEERVGAPGGESVPHEPDETTDTPDTPLPIRARPTQQALRDNVLSEIYREDDDAQSGSNVQSVQHTKKKSRKLLYLFITLGVLAAAAAAGYFTFARGSRFSERVVLTGTAASEVASGDEVTVSVQVKNEEGVELRDAELTYTPPEGFSFRSSTPSASNEFNNAWSLGTIQERGGTTVSIAGQLLGEQGASKVFTFTLTYRPANFNYDFQKTAEVRVTVNKTVLRITPEVPLRIPPKTSVVIPVTVENTGSEELSNVRLVAEYPEGFTYTSADPKPSEKENVWDVGALGPSEKRTVKITGTLDRPVGDTPEFKFRAGRVQAAGFQVQADVSGIGTVVQAGMALSIVATNPGSGAYIGWGETLNYVLTYKNESDAEMRDVSVSLEFNQKNAEGSTVSILDLDSRSDLSKGTLSGQTLTWTKKDVPALAAVAGGKSGDILLRVPVRSGPNIAVQADRNFVITAGARLTVGSIDGLDEKSVETQATPLTTKVTTKLNVEPEGRYYTDEQIPVGTGPLPPQVGQATTYELAWALSNPTNEVSQVVVSATLPEQVTWTGKQSVTAGQAVTFDPATREVSWRINRVPPGTGSLFASLEAKFEVSITPGEADVGKLLILLNQTAATARDEFTSQDLRVEKAIITTDLTGDVAAQGKGLVVAAPPAV